MKALGLQSITRATASSSDLSMQLEHDVEVVVVADRGPGITMRARWLVTPGGRMSSYSGCTTVLVEGVVTPKARRQAR